jgi:hypothetical protein
MSRFKTNAKNSDRTKDLFEKRSNYDKYSSDTGLITKRPAEMPREIGAVKDFSAGQRHLIGKVTPEYVSLLARTEKLRRCSYANEGAQIAALDFVATAFDDMAMRYDELARGNRVNTGLRFGSPSQALESIRAFKGYQNPLVAFSNQVTAYHIALNESLTKAERDGINNLSDYLRIYVDVLASANKVVPYHLSDYVRSPYNSPLTTGLVIEIADENYSDDGRKTEYFLQSSNFRLYTKLAQEFGFMIDKDIPWRLVADITSAAMQKRMSSNMALDKALYEYYLPIDFDDFTLMLNDVHKAYNNFIDNNRYADKTATVDNGSPSVIFREPIDIMKLTQVPEAEWIKYYCQIKNKFSGIQMSEIELNRIVTLAQSKVGYTELEEIVADLNHKFNFSNFQKGSSTFEKQRRKNSVGNATNSTSSQIKDFYVANLFRGY